MEVTAKSNETTVDTPAVKLKYTINSLLRLYSAAKQSALMRKLIEAEVCSRATFYRWLQIPATSAYKIPPHALDFIAAELGVQASDLINKQG